MYIMYILLIIIVPQSFTSFNFRSLVNNSLAFIPENTFADTPLQIL